MNQRLKSLFIVTYPILALFGVVVSVDQYVHNNIIAAIGLAMVSFPILLFLGWLFMYKTARTSAKLIVYSIIVGVGTVVLVYGFYIGRAESMASIGFLSAISWFLYVEWYSTFSDRTNSKLNIGQSLPNLNFEDENGKLVNTKSLLGKKNILMFYRGNWCPLCMVQIEELVSDYKELESKGIQTLLISPQSHKKTKKLADKFNVNFKFLVDKGNEVAKLLNIDSENGLPTGFQVLGFDSDTVMPTIILTDQEGKIIHSDLTSNYRVRPEPRDLIKLFE